MKQKMNFKLVILILLLLPFLVLFRLIYFVYLFKNLIYKNGNFSNESKRFARLMPGIGILILLLTGLVLVFVLTTFTFTTDDRMLSNSQSFFVQCKKEINVSDQDVCSDSYQRARLKELILENKNSGSSIDLNLSKSVFKKTENNLYHNDQNRSFLIKANINTSYKDKDTYSNISKNFAFNNLYQNLTQRGGYTFLDEKGNDVLLLENRFNNNQNLKSWEYFFSVNKNIKRIPQKNIIDKALIKKNTPNALFNSGKFELMFKLFDGEDKLEKKTFVQTDAKTKKTIIAPENALIHEMLKNLKQKNDYSLFDHQAKTDVIEKKWKEIIKKAKITKAEKEKYNKLIIKIRQNKTSFLDPKIKDDLLKLMKDFKLINKNDIYLKYFQELIKENKIAFVVADLEQFWIKIKNVLIMRKNRSQTYDENLLKLLNNLTIQNDYIRVNNESFGANTRLKALNALLPAVFKDLTKYQEDDFSLKDHFIASKSNQITKTKITKNYFALTDLNSYFPNLVLATKFRNKGFFYEKKAHSFLWNNFKSDTSNLFTKYQWIFVGLIIFIILFIFLLSYFYQFFGFLISLFGVLFIGLSAIFIDFLNIEITFLNLFSITLFILIGVFWQLSFFTSLKRYSKQKISLNKIILINFQKHLQILNYYFVFLLFGIALFFGNGVGTLTTPLTNLKLNDLFFGWGEFWLLILFVSFLVHVVLFGFTVFCLFFSFDSLMKKTLYLFGYSFKEIGEQKFNISLQTKLDNFFNNKYFKNKFVIFLGILLIIFAFLHFADIDMLQKNEESSIWIQNDWKVNPGNNLLAKNNFGTNWEHNLYDISTNLEEKGITNIEPMQIIDKKEWFYGLKINQFLSESDKSYLINNNFVLMSQNKEHILFLSSDIISFLRLFGIILGFISAFILLRFGWEYFLTFVVAFVFKFSFIFMTLIVFNLGVNEYLLKLSLILLALDLLLMTHNYLSSYKKIQDLVAVDNANDNLKEKMVLKRSFAWINLFVFVLILFFVLINYQFWFFLILLPIVMLLNYSFIQIEKQIILKLKLYKAKLYTRLKTNIFFSVFKNNGSDEGKVKGVND